MIVRKWLNRGSHENGKIMCSLYRFVKKWEKTLFLQYGQYRKKVISTEWANSDNKCNAFMGKYEQDEGVLMGKC